MSRSWCVSAALVLACQSPKDVVDGQPSEDKGLTVGGAAVVTAVEPLRDVMAGEGLQGGANHPYTGPSFALPDPPMGLFSTGLAVADLNNDGSNELVVSSGNDVSPQLLAIFSQKDGQFETRPSWLSLDSDYQFKLCLGDVNNDGFTDVGVAVAMGRTGKTDEGGFKLYLNRAGVIEPSPSVRLKGFPGFACEFADLNADGWLDLALGGPGDSRSGLAGGVRTYLNKAGTFPPAPHWRSETLLVGDLAIADVNADGRADLAVAAEHTSVFFGRVAGGFATKPDWQSHEKYAFQYSVDTGNVRPGPGLSLVVAASCITQGQACNSAFAAYQPLVSAEAQWTYRPEPKEDAALRFSNVALADTNADGLLDLLTTSWESKGSWPTGKPVRVFPGKHGGYFDAELSYELKSTQVGQQLFPVDLFGTCSRPATFSATVLPGQNLFSLPHRTLSRIKSVQLEGDKPAKHRLQTVPGANWVSVFPAPLPGSQVKFSYVYSVRPDLVVANWAPNENNPIFVNRLACP